MDSQQIEKASYFCEHQTHKSHTVSFFILGIISILIFGNCSRIYSPFGIQGSLAIEEIEETRTIGNTITLPIQQEASGLNLDSVERPLCNPLEERILSSSDGSNPRQFTIPALGAILDLEAPSGSSHFFRSSSISSTGNGDLFRTLKLQVLRTTDTPNSDDNTCSFQLSTDCLSSLSLSDVGYFQILSDRPTDLGNSTSILADNSCLKIRCNSRAIIRLRNDPLALQAGGVSTNFDVANFVVGTDIFQSLANIDPDRYYTMESFNACKDAVLFVTIWNAGQNLQLISDFRNRKIQSRYCNSSIPELSTQGGNFISNLVQGGACSLEEVNLLGF